MTNKKRVFINLLNSDYLDSEMKTTDSEISFIKFRDAINHSYAEIPDEHRGNSKIIIDSYYEYDVEYISVGIKYYVPMTDLEIEEQKANKISKYENDLARAKKNIANLEAILQDIKSGKS